jgi:hypothetical protein
MQCKGQYTVRSDGGETVGVTLPVAWGGGSAFSAQAYYNPLFLIPESSILGVQSTKAKQALAMQFR